MLDLIPLALFDAASFFQWFVDHASYLFVFIFMTIESSFIPFPSEVIVPPAAYLACTGAGAGADMNIYVVTIVATLGALCGAFINYYLALWIGRPVVYSFADSRLGHICMINRQKVDKAEAYFDRHGAISTFVGRLIPAIRQLISIPAGLARMNPGRFAVFTSLGALVWNAILSLLGWILAKSVPKDLLFEKVEEYNRYLTLAGYALAVLIILYILWKVLAHRRTTSENSNTEP